MKLKLLLLIPLLLYISKVKAQNCMSHTDSQTSKVTKSGTTELTVDSALRSSSFSIVKTDSTLAIGLRIISPLAASNFDATSMKLTINYSDGHAKTYTANSNTNIMAIPAGTGVIFQASLTTDDLNYFQNPITKFIINFNEQNGLGTTIQVSQLNANQIINSLNCLK